MGMPMEISNEWLNKINYKISIPKRAFCRGEHIPIDISIKPHNTQQQQLHVRHISCFLKEYTTFIQANHKESKIIRFFRDEAFPSTGPHWNKTETLSIPYSFDAVQCDTRNEYFKVEHKLKFTISFINTLGELSELRASIPIDIMHRRLQSSTTTTADTIDELPTYENACRSAAYSPLLYLESSTNNTRFNRTNRVSMYSLSDDDDHILTPPDDATGNDYFNFQPVRPSCDQDSPSYYSIFTPPSYHV